MFSHHISELDLSASFGATMLPQFLPRDLNFDDQYFRATLYGAFHSAAPSDHGLSLMHGFLRPGDEEIASLINSRLKFGKKVSALEIGAGTSYPTMHDSLWGAPFAARRLGMAAAIQYPGALDILVTDSVQEETMVKFVRFSDGQLCWWQTPRGIPSPRAADQSKIAWVKGSADPSNPNSGKCFFRPLLDRELEAFFGVQVQGGVNFYNLQSTLGERLFDVVYARNLPCYLYDEDARRELICHNAKSVLAPGGAALLYFEDRCVEIEA